jgi:hypothetical protein
MLRETGSGDLKTENGGKKLFLYQKWRYIFPWASMKNVIAAEKAIGPQKRTSRI